MNCLSNYFNPSNPPNPFNYLNYNASYFSPYYYGNYKSQYPDIQNYCRTGEYLLNNQYTPDNPYVLGNISSRTYFTPTTVANTNAFPTLNNLSNLPATSNMNTTYNTTTVKGNS